MRPAPRSPSRPRDRSISADLNPQTTYFYSCGDAEAGFSPVYNFTTAPAAGAEFPYTVALIADMGNWNSNNTFVDLGRITPEIDVILQAGDISYAGAWRVQRMYPAAALCVTRGQRCYCSSGVGGSGDFVTSVVLAPNFNYSPSALHVRTQPQPDGSSLHPALLFACVIFSSAGSEGRLQGLCACALPTLPAHARSSLSALPAALSTGLPLPPPSVASADDAFLHDPLVFGYEAAWNTYMQRISDVATTWKPLMVRAAGSCCCAGEAAVMLAGLLQCCRCRGAGAWTAAWWLLRQRRCSGAAAAPADRSGFACAGFPTLQLRPRASISAAARPHDCLPCLNPPFSPPLLPAPSLAGPARQPRGRVPLPE